MSYAYAQTEHVAPVEWHFDINGWIDKGLAIDVNTLETNPYE